jgi:hypothetical protein
VHGCRRGEPHRSIRRSCCGRVSGRQPTLALGEGASGWREFRGRYFPGRARRRIRAIPRARDRAATAWPVQASSGLRPCP